MRHSTGAVVANEATFVEIVEALSLGLPYRVRVSADGNQVRFVEIGAHCLEMIGAPAEALLANADAFLERVVPQDRDRLIAESGIGRRQSRRFSTQIRMLGPDGELRWLSIRAAPRPRPDGACDWDGLVTDITESKRLAQQLEAERRRLEQAIEITRMGVFQWRRGDPASLRWSDHQYEIYGIAPGAPMTVEKIIAMVHPEDFAALETARKAALDGPEGGDFAYEYRIVRPSGEVRWILQHQRIESDAAGGTWVQGTTLDVTERRNAEERRRLQMRELAHRGKNALTVLAAMVHQAGRDAASVEDLVEVLMARIQAMARSQDLATASEGRPLALPVLARQALDVFDIARFDFDSALETLTVSGEAVIGMALLLHELATNAVKYGALSTADGRVRLSRAAAGDGRVAVLWRETGGPPVQPPARQGFGMRLLGAVLQAANGRVEPAFEPAGFEARIELPAG